MSGPPKETVGPPTSAGFESAERTTPMGIEPVYDFASDDAAELWQEKGRPALPTEGRGKDGAITTADVRAALKEEE